MNSVTPKIEVPQSIVCTPTAWQEVEAVLLKHYHKPDLQAARALYSAIAAHRLKGQPVWAMLVGPPGSMKTELLNGLQGRKDVHFIDQITAQTFISGHIVKDEDQDSDVPAGLLGRIGKSGYLVYPDFSTVLAMKAEAKASVLADLRRIYDGELRKEFGTANKLNTRQWSGRLTVAVGATPDVDSQYSIFQSLGERFLMIRWGRPDGIEAALTAMNQDQTAARMELREAVANVLDEAGGLEPEVSQELQLQIAALADLVTRARTHVARSGYNKQMLYAPEAEAPTRLSQQLTQLAKGSALLDGRAEVSTSDYQMVLRVALDCVPTLRRKVLTALMRGESLATLGPASTITYVLEDLQELGLTASRQLSPLAWERLEMAGVFTRTPTPSGMVN